MGEKHEAYKNNEHDCIHWNIYGRLFARRAEKGSNIFYAGKNKDNKEDAPVEKQQAEQEKKEEPQAVQTNEQVPAEEKKEEATPVQPTEQLLQNNEQKVESNEKQGKFLVVIDPGHQQKANLNLEPIGPGATTQKYKVTDGTTGVVTKKERLFLC